MISTTEGEAPSQGSSVGIVDFDAPRESVQINDVTGYLCDQVACFDATKSPFITIFTDDSGLRSIAARWDQIAPQFGRRVLDACPQGLQLFFSHAQISEGVFDRVAGNREVRGGLRSSIEELSELSASAVGSFAAFAELQKHCGEAMDGFHQLVRFTLSSSVQAPILDVRASMTVLILNGNALDQLPSAVDSVGQALSARRHFVPFALHRVTELMRGSTTFFAATYPRDGQQDQSAESAAPLFNGKANHAIVRGADDLDAIAARLKLRIHNAKVQIKRTAELTDAVVRDNFQGNETMKQRVLQLHRAGLSPEEIAAHFSVEGSARYAPAVRQELAGTPVRGQDADGMQRSGKSDF